MYTPVNPNFTIYKWGVRGINHTDKYPDVPRLGKRELVSLLLFTCNYVVSVWRGFLFLWVLGIGYVILLRHSLSLPYNYFGNSRRNVLFLVKTIIIVYPKLFFSLRMVSSIFGVWNRKPIPDTEWHAGPGFTIA